MAAIKKVKEPLLGRKGYLTMRATDPKVDKTKLVGDASVSDLLKTNFL